MTHKEGGRDESRVRIWALESFAALLARREREPLLLPKVLSVEFPGSSREEGTVCGHGQDSLGRSGWVRGRDTGDYSGRQDKLSA